jgi:hypothetical protein
MLEILHLSLEQNMIVSYSCRVFMTAKFTIVNKTHAPKYSYYSHDSFSQGDRDFHFNDHKVAIYLYIVLGSIMRGVLLHALKFVHGVVLQQKDNLLLPDVNIIPIFRLKFLRCGAD